MSAGSRDYTADRGGCECASHHIPRCERQHACWTHTADRRRSGLLKVCAQNSLSADLTFARFSGNIDEYIDDTCRESAEQQSKMKSETSQFWSDTQPYTAAVV